jgi:light-regulated signal transduction histidine kinase (bacteriophytochrome)
LQVGEPERQVTLRIAEGISAEGDMRLLRVVLENLLGNAWKFTSKHATACIEFGVAEQDGERVYFVRDDGAGFDQAYANKLFGAFQRLHDAEEFSGTGIGLATVARIVHRHGGRVWAEGALERGATFYFTLPSAEITRETGERSLFTG